MTLKNNASAIGFGGLAGMAFMSLPHLIDVHDRQKNYTQIPTYQKVGEQYMQPSKLSYEIADRDNDGVNEFYFMYDGARLLAEEIKPVTAGYESIPLGFKVTPVEIVETKPVIKPVLYNANKVESK